MSYQKIPKINVEYAVDQGEEEPLSPTARTLLHGHHLRINCHIIVVFGFKVTPNITIFKNGVEDTLMKHHRFSSKLVTDERGEMKWVRTKVDLDEHIIVPDIDPDMENPDQFVQNYISNLTITPMDMSRPLWTFHFLNVKTSDAVSIGVLCVHHSMGDGASLMSLLLACSRKTNNSQALPTLPTQRFSPVSVSEGYWGWFSWIWFVILMFWNTVVDVLVFMATILFLKDSENPLTIQPESSVVSRRQIVYKSVSLDDVKLVKKAMNMTINDVVLGATQAGLSRYLTRSSQGSNIKQHTSIKNKRISIPQNIRCRAVVNVNLRPAKGIQALADMMAKGSKVKWGNWTGYIILPFKVASQNDPLNYIREAKATIDRKKLSLGALCTFLIARFACNTFGVKAAAGIAHRIFAHTTAAFSNVMGPPDEISFYGHPLAFIAPSVYGVDQALTIHFLSYVNKMTIVLGVDPTVIPDPYQLCDDIEESLKSIKDAVIQRGIFKDFLSSY